MAITVKLYVEDVAAVMATYNQIRLYRDTSPTGAFSLLAATIALVADQEEYNASDTSGLTSSWYRFTYYNSGAGEESEQSEAFRPTGLQMQTIRLEAARRAGAGFDGVCTMGGTVTTLVDGVLRDQGVEQTFLNGAWIYRPYAPTGGDRVRRTAKDGFDAATGTLTVIREWAEAPAADEIYHLFLLLPPTDAGARGTAYSWDRAIRDGLRETFYTDELNLGEGTANYETRFDMGTHVGYVERDQLLNVLLRTTDQNGIVTDVLASKNGRFWTAVENGRGSLTLILTPAPTVKQTVIAQVSRRYEALYKDEDVTECPLELAVRATVWKAFEHLEREQKGKYQGELADAYRAFYGDDEGRPLAAVKGA